MKKIKSYFPLIILLAIALVACLAIYKSNIKQNLGKENFANSTKKQLFLPKNEKIPLLLDKNKVFSLKNLQNDEGKYNIVNIFASWCSSCLLEHETLFKLAKNKSVRLYGIAWNDYSQNAKKYLEKFGNPYLQVALDSKGVLNKILGIAAVPETFLVDANGYVVYRHQGTLTEHDFRYLLSLREKNK